MEPLQTMQESTDDNDIFCEICVITQHPIKIPSFTLTGSVYECEAITKWLKTKNIDPKTGIVLPSQKIFLAQEPFTKTHIKKQSLHLKQQMIQDWGKYFVIGCLLKHKQSTYRSKFAQIKTRIQLTFAFDEWLKYSEELFSFVLTVDQHFRDCLFELHSTFQGDERASVINHFLDASLKTSCRLDHSPHDHLFGFGTSFLNLSRFHYKHNREQVETLLKHILPVWPNFQITKIPKVISNVVFPKYLHFLGSDLTNLIFFNCAFFQTDFSYANLTGTVFMFCRFGGQKTLFYKTCTDVSTTFFQCHIETAHVQHKLVDLQPKHLQHRGLFKSSVSVCDKTISDSK